jgi:formylmethanofuran dehydrogenase subunit B
MKTRPDDAAKRDLDQASAVFGGGERTVARSPRTIVDVACTMCGCVCDDLRVTVDGQRVAEFSPPCPLAEPWLLGQTGAEDIEPARVDGQVAPLETAIERAAGIMRRSVSPLVYGLSRSSTPGQRAAVRLADRIGAYVDTTASTCHAPSIMALQVIGESTATLGEVRERSDLIVYWGSNPLDSHPRHVERVVEMPGMLIPGGRSDRHLVVVDVEQTESARMADTFIQVHPGGDFELIWALRALLRGIPVDSGTVAGVNRDVVRRLAETLRSCRHGAVFFGLGLTRHGVPHATVEALLRLVTDLNAHTRFIARRMRIPGDVAGADTVLCWQTGFPFSVSLTRGYPRYNPGEYTANSLLERGEVDAVLLVGSEGVAKLTDAARRNLQRIPTIVLDYPRVSLPIQPAVQFTTAVYGIHRPGTAYRMDEVPIPLRSVLESPLPADHEILESIQRAVR